VLNKGDKQAIAKKAIVSKPERNPAMLLMNPV